MSITICYTDVGSVIYINLYIMSEMENDIWYVGASIKVTKLWR